MIIYDVLQRYYDERCSLENAHSIAENKEVAGHCKCFENQLKNTIMLVLKDLKLTEC